ncbi:hypothetical protein L950_0214990 [Sphingobacterium sp. IITKGP-BTPF85]|nr:hypothetical protein L950_0214990 [Sphingobacterium sp. IITKGP-BTPF85]
MFNENTPALLVDVPAVVPLTKTVAPCKGVPSELLTEPFTSLFCAYARFMEHILESIKNKAHSLFLD